MIIPQSIHTARPTFACIYFPPWEDKCLFFQRKRLDWVSGALNVASTSKRVRFTSFQQDNETLFKRNPQRRTRVKDTWICDFSGSWDKFLMMAGVDIKKAFSTLTYKPAKLALNWQVWDWILDIL